MVVWTRANPRWVREREREWKGLIKNERNLWWERVSRFKEYTISCRPYSLAHIIAAPRVFVEHTIMRQRFNLPCLPLLLPEFLRGKVIMGNVKSIFNSTSLMNVRIRIVSGCFLLNDSRTNCSWFNGLIILQCYNGNINQNMHAK